ncbi:hypothetical protein CDL12_00489 [Handroanthus impetiginosus]|uniref:Uncharacterized protein n=1 Tax=Handroanthus impetiginosus TaxID=429701 RepID=A0A2G9IAT0_9LAMI|nr:hypothetical protein CDL12_00489 [Handroanthus impetiginosus]
MAVNSSEECQNVHSVMVVLPDGGATNPQYEPVPNACHMEVPNMVKKEMSLNPDPNLLSHTNMKMDKVNNHAPCNLDVDIEEGKAGNPKSTEESICYAKSDDSAREICLQMGGKFMQFLMNHSPELPRVTSKDKFLAERVSYDGPTNRSRKYKRSASFNSRKVVLLFSFMSSMGTIILIYLTLRVRQISDWSGNV